MSDINDGEDQGSSRRALIKGAVAAGVGVAAYTVPTISSVPAYADHGLESYSFKTADFCTGWSPNNFTWFAHTGGDGTGYKSSFTKGKAKDDKDSVHTITFTGQTPVNITFEHSQSPNVQLPAGEYNTPANSGAVPPAKIHVDNALCEVYVKSVNCTACGKKGDYTTSPAPAAPSLAGLSSNPIQGVQTATYSSGTNERGSDGDKCYTSLVYEVRCNF